jgi:hypothetical protein
MTYAIMMESIKLAVLIVIVSGIFFSVYDRTIEIAQVNRTAEEALCRIVWAN